MEVLILSIEQSNDKCDDIRNINFLSSIEIDTFISEIYIWSTC